MNVRIALLLLPFCLYWGQVLAQPDPFANAKSGDIIPKSALPKEVIDTSLIDEVAIPSLATDDDNKKNKAADKKTAADDKTIPAITCQQFDELRRNLSPNQKLYLLDTRTAKEFNTSHIEGAKRIGLEDFNAESVWAYNRKATLVIYSFKGEQGDKIGLELRELGFTNVYNLQGSLVEWVNQGFPLVDATGAVTNKVQVQNKAQAKAIKKAKAVY